MRRKASRRATPSGVEVASGSARRPDRVAVRLGEERVGEGRFRGVGVT